MASVSSLDQDMKKLRMSRYTPSAANEVRAWIEETLGEKLPAGDLLEALKDGVALCQYVNLQSYRNGKSHIFCQARKYGIAAARHQIQKVKHAFCADGEHLTLSARLRIASTIPACARQVPHS
jgi:hypothetical protein